MTPGRLVAEVETAQENGLLTEVEAAELRFLADAVRHVCRKPQLSVRMLRASVNCPTTATWPKAWTACNAAQFQSFGLPISDYMLHLRRVLGLEKRFALRDGLEARKFAIWYACEAHRYVGAGWVPISEALRAALLTSEEDVSRLGLKTADNAVNLPPRTFVALAETLNRILLLGIGDNYEKDLGSAVAKYLNAVPVSGAKASRLELCLAMLARLPYEPEKPATPIWQLEDVKNFAVKARGKEPVDGAHKAAPKMVVSGFVGAKTGLAENMEMSCNALARIGIGAAKHGFCDSPSTNEAFLTEGATRLIKRKATLHHLNGERIPQSIIKPEMAEPDRLHIGYLLWEFEEVPQEHRLALDLLDEIWVPSRFVEHIYTQATDKPVHCIGKAIEASIWDAAERPIDREDRSDFTFLVAFDFHSSVARKNPGAALRAFQHAFPPEDPLCRNTKLIIKTTPTSHSHWGDPEGQIAQIRRAVAKDNRITLIEESYSRGQLLGLIADADCLVSSHRAEGFGLIPAYAMALGTPVVATDYSGTRDFCSHRTAFPVAADMVDVAPNHMIHPAPGARWATIRHDDLVDTLRAVQAYPAVARRRALQGKRLMQETYGPEAFAARYAKRLSTLGVI